MANIAELATIYGEQIVSENLGRGRVMKLTGLGEKAARSLIRRVREQQAQKSISSNPKSATPQSEQALNDVSGWSLNEQSYVYDEKTDTYHNFIKGRTLQVTGESLRDMKRLYSEWGGGVSINRLATQFRIPRAVLVELIRIHKWTHDSEPFTDEEIVSREIPALTNDALIMRKHQLAVAMDEAAHAALKKDAQHWREFQHRVLDCLIQHVPGTKLPSVRVMMPVANRPFALVMAPQDFHWGGYGWVDETGESYNRAEAEKRLLEHTQYICGSLPGRPEKIYLSVGGDWFHVDGDHAATTKGTPMEPDGSPAEILITGCELAIRQIELLRQIAPVELVFMGGNHDRNNSLTLLLYLSAWYRNTKDVMIQVTPKLRSYRRYRNTLMGFTHGDKVKPNHLGHVMATEAASEWGATKSRIWFTGHLHHEVVREVGGIVQYQLPSLAGSDRWHARQGYVTSRAGLCGHLVGEDGVFMSLFSNVKGV